MSYERVGWKDYPSTSTALEAKKLNQMDEGIADAHEEIARLNAAMQNIADTIFPVGSIIMSTSNVNPGSFLGGEWEAWANGRMPIGVNSAYQALNDADKKGGVMEHNLMELLPAHNHAYKPLGTITDTTVNVNVEGANANIAIADTTATGTVQNHRHQNDAQTVYSSQVEGVTVASGTNVRSNVNLGKPVGTRYSCYSQPAFYGQPHTHQVIQNGHAHAATVTPHSHTFHGKETYTDNTGKMGTVTNLPPYQTCYMWKRIG